MQPESPLTMNNASRDFRGWFGLHMDFLHQRVIIVMFVLQTTQASAITLTSSGRYARLILNEPA